MKFDVEIPSLKGTVRLEIKTILEESQWAAYLSFTSGRTMDETVLMLGTQGLPHRFAGSTEKEAHEAAKIFLEKNYHIVRTVW